MPYIKSTFESCGYNVVIGNHAIIAGAENIRMGDDIHIVPEALLYTTKAKLIFRSHITIGPRLTIITGDHRTDIVGRYI